MPRSLRAARPARLAAAVLGLALVGIAAGPATAGNVWTVNTADSPSNGLPVAGGGSWIVNKPSGYYLGRAMPGDRFDDEQTTAANWHWGRAVTGIDMCGWAMPGSMATKVEAVADSCSTTTQASLSHRLTFGRDYNAPAHATGDGTASPAAPGCTLYYNYFHGTDFTSDGGHWADPAGTASATVMYRFTTRDGQAAVVRDPALGWGFLPVGCVTRPAALYNDND